MQEETVRGGSVRVERWIRAPPLVSVEANENLDDSADNLLRWSGEIYASIKGFTTR